MAIQTMTIEPALTADEIVAGVNAATDNITRAGSVEPSARPIETEEIGADEIEDGTVSATELTADAAMENLNSMPDAQREYIKTRPTTGKYKVVAVQRDDAGLLEIEYDDVVEP